MGEVPDASLDTLSFRLEPDLRQALTRAAVETKTDPEDLLRHLIREHVARRERLAFEAEARHQSRIVAKAAKQHSDEAQILRELDHQIESPADEWR